MYKVFNKDIFKDHTNLCVQNYQANQNFKKPNILNLLCSTFSYNRCIFTDFHNNYTKSIQPLPIPFWHVPKIDIKLDLFYQIEKKIFSPIQSKILTMEYINKFLDFLHIYTDGSKQDNNRTASAVYIPEFDIKIDKRIPDECSVFTSELTAIILALKWITEFKPSNIVLFSDSLSCLFALQNLQKHIQKNALFKEIAILITEIFYNDTKIILTWIPSHINLKENDKVDYIAKNATLSNEIQINIPLNLNEINKEILIHFQSYWKTIYNNNNKGIFFRTIETDFDKIQPINMTNRHMEKTIFRLKTGHCLLNSHLHRIGLHDSGFCEFCNEPETVKHYLLDCLNYQNYQEEIISYAHKYNILISIESILNNKTMYPVIYNYVIQTKRTI
jgi:ribonuclease HI